MPDVGYHLQSAPKLFYSHPHGDYWCFKNPKAIGLNSSDEAQIMTWDMINGPYSTMVFISQRQKRQVSGKTMECF